MIFYSNRVFAITITIVPGGIYIMLHFYTKLTNALTRSLLIFTEVRQEAVQQALAAMQTRPKPSLPMPSKRTSVLDREPHDSGKFLF